MDSETHKSGYCADNYSEDKMNRQKSREKSHRSDYLEHFYSKKEIGGGGDCCESNSDEQSISMFSRASFRKKKK